METTKFLSDKAAEKSKFRKPSTNRKYHTGSDKKVTNFELPDPEFEIRGGGRSSRLLEKRRGRSQKFFGGHRASIWSKNKGGGRSCPSPGSANALVWNYLMALRKFAYKFKEIITLILLCVELIMSNNDKVYLKNSEWLAIPCMSSRCFARLKSFYTS